MLKSSWLARACRHVPILVWGACGCLFLFCTSLPTLVWDVQHPELHNWLTGVNHHYGKAGTWEKASWRQNIVKQEASQVSLSLIDLIYKTQLWKMILFPLINIAFPSETERCQTPSCEQSLSWVLPATWQSLPIMKALLISVSEARKSGCGHCMAIPSVQLTYIDSYLLPICPWHCAVTGVTIFFPGIFPQSNFLLSSLSMTFFGGYCALLKKTGGRVSASVISEVGAFDSI